MTKQKKLTRADATDIDLVKVLDIIEKMNTQIYELEVKNEEQIKLANLTTNTINYILATVYVYESYFVEMGVDQEMLKKEIEQVFYDAFNKQETQGKTPQYSKNIIKKVNDKLRQFQEKVNQEK